MFHQGDAGRSVYVLRSGLLKAYYVSDDGKENVKSFIQPGELIGSLSAAYRKEACSFGLVCLAPSVVVALEFDSLYEAARTDLDLAQAMVDLLLAFAMKKERRGKELLTQS
ncbi:MAG: Crp/Fnr family transcriptional regulator, partial [Pseudomonadota bacterium]